MPSKVFLFNRIQLIVALYLMRRVESNFFMISNGMKNRETQRHKGGLMNRQIAWILILGMGVFACSASFAQQKRPYNDLMKDVAATFASVKKNLDANAAPAAAADAAKLQTLFKETEDFWAQFKTKDALDAAKGAQDAAAAIIAAAKANNVQKAQVSYNGVGKFCNACHTSHREQMPDKTYKIKP
jgi:cytochrome c556